MATDVLLPQWGMNMEDGLLVKWLVNEGDEVAEGQPIVEVETAKIDSELESPASGVVAHIMVSEDDVRQAIEARATVAAGPKVQVVPRARQLAREHSLDLSQVQGTGPGGRILVADVENALAARSATPAGEVVSLTGLRRSIAERMTESAQTMAPVTLTTETDVTELVKLRESLLSSWRPHRVRPLDLDLIVKATAAALREHPRLNSHLNADRVTLLEEINVGIAMAVPDGLMVPVILRADEKDLLAIANEIRDLNKRARDNELSVDDVTGASFTITSLASYDIDAFTPIIDPPQVAILGIGRIVERPVVYEGQIAIRSMMALSLTFDHRALDGVPAGEFLRALRMKLEKPGWMVTSGAA